MEITVTVKGIPSGDHECWCLLVTKEDFERVTQRAAEEFDQGPFAAKDSPYRYMLYPNYLVHEAVDDSPITVTVRTLVGE